MRVFGLLSDHLILRKDDLKVVYVEFSLSLVWSKVA